MQIVLLHTDDTDGTDEHGLITVKIHSIRVIRVLLIYDQLPGIDPVLSL